MLNVLIVPAKCQFTQEGAGQYGAKVPHIQRHNGKHAVDIVNQLFTVRPSIL
jgi:hypothetical protein